MAYIPKYRKSRRVASVTSQESDLEKLVREARKHGINLDDELDDEKKESFFRKTIDFISRPNYASAGAAKALVRGDENPLKEAWKGLKGEDKETYSDVLAETGVKNKWVKGGVGLALDIALDPLTYLGGTAVKGVLKGAGIGAKFAGKGASKVAPATAKRFAEGGKLVKEGFQEAFSYYKPGVTRELADKTAVQKNILAKVGDDVDDKIIEYFGNFKNNDEMMKAQDIFFNNSLIDSIGVAKKAGNMDMVSRLKKGLTSNKISLGSTPEQKEILRTIQRLGKETAELFGIKNPKEWYFPGISMKKLAESGQGLGSLTQAKGLHAKQAFGLIDDADRVKDAKKAFAIVLKRGMDDRLKTKFLDNIVTTYGVKNLDEGAEKVAKWAFKIISYIILLAFLLIMVSWFFAL